MPRRSVLAVSMLVAALAVVAAAQTPSMPFLGRWKFNPAKRHGAAVDVVVDVSVEFKMR